MISSLVAPPDSTFQLTTVICWAEARFEAETEPFNLLYIKTNRRRGGFVENVTMERVEATSTKFGVFGIETDVLYQWRTLVPTYEERLTSIRGITVRDVRVGGTATPFRILGDEREPVRDVLLSNITIGTVRSYSEQVPDELRLPRRLVKATLESLEPMPRPKAMIFSLFALTAPLLTAPPDAAGIQVAGVPKAHHWAGLSHSACHDRLTKETEVDPLKGSCISGVRWLNGELFFFKRMIPEG